MLCVIAGFVVVTTIQMCWPSTVIVSLKQPPAYADLLVLTIRISNGMFRAPTTRGNTVMENGWNVGVSSVSEVGVTWTLLAVSKYAPNVRIEMWVGKVESQCYGGSAGTSVTVTLNGTSQNTVAVVAEYSGVTSSHG